MNIQHWKYTLAPAKINLYFEVIQRLPSGYHEIKSLVTPISLYDTVMVRSAETLSFRVEGIAETEEREECIQNRIPADETNLVLRAARLLQKHSGNMDGADIILQKRIPSQAGLGGGSSDAAAALILLSDVWKLGYSRDDLAEMGAELGCDVPLFLKGFPVICRGRGEVLEAVSDGESLPPLSLVVVKPSEGCSTPEVYRRCTPVGSSNDSEYRLKNMVQYWREARWQALAACLENRLSAPAVAVSPGIERVMNMFHSLPDPCLGVSMTGSGSACFGLCRDHAHAAEIADFFVQHQSGMIFAAESVSSPLAIS